MSPIIPFSEACERNKDVILEVISPYLKKVDSVLEIGTGTAQHALHFAASNSHLRWQTSDQTVYLSGIRAQLEQAQLGNVLLPLELNVNQPVWVKDGSKFPAVYTANTFHIMSIDDVHAFFSGVGSVVTKGAFLLVYGPFKYNGQFTSESNATFDQSLQSRGVGSGIRDIETVNMLAAEVGFSLIEDNAMPANNQCLIWQRNRFSA